MPMPLSETASIWASAIALLAVAGAWFTYFGTARASRRRTYEGLSNMVTGIEKELDLMWHWAGRRGGDGYLRSTQARQYLTQRPEWRNPTRVVFSFEYPTIRNLTRSAYLNYLKAIVDDFVLLNFSIGRLYDYYNEYRVYANMRPDLYDSVVSKFRQFGPPTPAHYSQKELEYTQRLFDRLYQFHVEYIGGKDSPDPRCLYKALQVADQSLESFKKKHVQKPEPLPWWYWVLYFASFPLVAAALLLLLEWGGIVHVLSPKAIP